MPQAIISPPRVDMGDRAEPEHVKWCVDRLADIERQLDEQNIRELLKEADDLKTYLRTKADSAPADESVVLHGNYGHAEFTACTQQRVVTNKLKLKKMLGAQLYDQLATFSMASLEHHLPKKAIATVISKEYGSRRLKRAWMDDQVKH